MFIQYFSAPKIGEFDMTMFLSLFIVFGFDKNIDFDELRRSFLNLLLGSEAVIECRGEAIKHYLWTSICFVDFFFVSFNCQSWVGSGPHFATLAWFGVIHNNLSTDPFHTVLPLLGQLKLCSAGFLKLCCASGYIPYPCIFL